MTPYFQVSFQGGGALLALMVPIAHAFSEAQSLGRIRLSGVSGSSAGSVAAALLAANADFDELRKYCRHGLRADVRRTAGRYYDELGRFDAARALIRVALGKDLVPRDRLKKLFQSIFAAARVELNTPTPDGIRDLDIADFESGSRPILFVTRSSLRAAGLDMPRKGPLLDLLIDSCAIPFAVRNVRSALSAPFVDGGLCENLPVVAFDQDTTTPILAVSVDDGQRLPERFDIFQFALSLFSTSINHNVSRAKRAVGALMTIEHKSPFCFHQISKAVEWISSDMYYDKVYQETLRSILDLADYHSQQHADGIFLTGRSTIKSRDSLLNKILHESHDPDDFSIERAELQVSAESLNNPDPGAYRKMDIISSVARVKVNNSLGRSYKSYAPLLDGHIRPMTWSVLNTRTNKHIPFTPYHYHDDEDGGLEYDPCFIRFESPQSWMIDGDLLVIRSVYPVMPSFEKLISEKKDFLSIENGHMRPVPLEITFVFPNYLGDVRVSERERSGSACAFRELDQHEVRERLGDAALGRRMIGVRSREDVPPRGWLSIFVERD